MIAVMNVLIACSVCFSANEENRFAYLAMTVFMSLLPLAAIGGSLFYVWRKTGGGDVFAERSDPPQLAK